MELKKLRNIAPNGGQKSFYGKALTDGKVCLSYGTKIAEIKGGELFIYGWYSNTSQRHLNAFLSENGFPIMNKKEIVNYQNKKTK